ncbi:MAG TPA: circularly permuted type 2 ATP-grasp protein [Methylophilaceae bacterium]
MAKNNKSFFDEMSAPDGAVRPLYNAFDQWLTNVSHSQLTQKSREAELLFRRVGITFNVYGEDAGAERLIPFDVIPRILAASEWQRLSDGAIQRVRALNMFLHDLYHGQEIIKAGVVPASILTNSGYRPEMQGVDVPGNIYAHIAGIDIVRTGENQFYVLEDNLRTPSGVSYMLEDRKMMMRLFPDLFRRYSVAPVEHYPQVLLNNLRAVAQPGVPDPTVVLMTPGAYNSAYFEHAFLAQQMGIELVEGQDLFVRDNAVFMRTTEGPKRVDVIYRRIDDDFIDPLAFRADSMLGVPGLVSVYRNGGVTLANAIGTGVADDKATYTYVPEMVRFYLGEEPILSNVPTYKLELEDDCKYVLEHLAELVVKEVQGSGGYGMLVGPSATKEQIEDFRKRIKANPGNYIAQPTLALSTCPTLVEQGIAPRHVDLRPFVLSGKTVTLVPGALCRVALTDGSLVVNSSQGGGTKDTWVLNEFQYGVQSESQQQGQSAC